MNNKNLGTKTFSFFLITVVAVIIVMMLKCSGIWENTLLPWLQGKVNWIPILLFIIVVACLIESMWLGCCSVHLNRKEKKYNKISEEDAKNKVYEILKLTSNDKAQIDKILREILKKDKQQEKEFDKQSREYWMYIWKIVYIIQRYYAKKGYLEYAYSTLLEEKSMFDIFSENNLITAVSIALGILGIIGGKTNIKIAYTSLMLIILIVLIENVRAVFENRKPKNKEKKFYREIIEGVLNASKK